MEERATGFTKSAKWHDCDRAALLLLPHVHRKGRTRCCGGTLPPERGHYMLECPGSSSSEEPASLAADPAVDSARAAARDLISSKLEHSDADGKAELGLVRRRLVKTSRSTAATKKGAGQESQEMGPWCEKDQTEARTTFSRNTVKARAVRLEPGRKPNNTSRRASSLPGVGAPGKLLSSDLTHHTTTV